MGLLFLQYAVYRNMGGSCTCCKMSGIDSKLPSSYLEDLLFHSYMTYRTLTANILSYSAKCCQLSESAVSAKKSKAIWHHLIRVCFLAPLHLYRFRCTPVAQGAYPAIQQVKSNFPCWIGMSCEIPKFRWLQNDPKCSEYWYLLLCIRAPRDQT